MEILKGISPQDCGQLNGRASCDGCPVYSTAKAIITENGGDTTWLQTTQLTSQCPAGAEMDVAGLGVIVSKVRSPVLEDQSATCTVTVRSRGPYFVR